MSEAAAFQVLDAAFSLGIRAFDTAEAYGSSAARLRAWSDDRENSDALEVVTKFSVDAGQSAETVEENAEKALSRFEGIGRLTVLSHGALPAESWPALLVASRRHHAAAGQSVYSPDEVARACELPNIGRVQAPGNVLDQRALRARGRSPLRLDLRSIYLQGVLLDDREVADLRAPGAGRISAAIQVAAAAADSAAAPLLVASMLRIIEPGDRLVVGVDDASDLDVLPAAFEIPDATVEHFRNMIAHLADDPALGVILDPRQWPRSPAE
jgi:aldo/keto reductase family protein